jgi:hypothetical protein
VKDVKVTQETQELPQYEAPTITTLTNAQILEELGPAQAIYGDEPVFNP